jgi:cytochrome o ubiquinol oxidase subunit 2
VKPLFRLFSVIAVAAAIITLFAVVLHGHTIAVLNPKGPVARQELDLMITATILMLLIVVPVFILTAWIAWKYRATNTKAKYTPDWDRNKWLEGAWWALPCLIIAVLATITWTSTHALDPYKPLSSSVPQMTIQVVALDWKWLFIYPQQNIATVNFVEFPNQTPVDFQITSDAPMNSFWIPQLGGQIYAMPGMETQMHLMADRSGIYNGSSANISGEGFAGMTFKAKSVTTADFNNWLLSVRKSKSVLSQSTYSSLVKPSSSNPVQYYSTTDPNLYDGIMAKFMAPQNTSDTSSNMESLMMSQGVAE